MNVDTLTIEQVNAELLARHSRTSGTHDARRERLKRFLDFEKQKERRDRFVRQVKAEMEEEEECYDGCPCNYEEEEEKAKQAAEALLNLRQNGWVEQNIRLLLESINELDERLQTSEAETSRLNQAFIDLDESYEVVVGENLRLNQRLNNLEMRLSHLENRSDSPPPLIFPESNPNWCLDTAFTTYTSSPVP